MKAIVECEQPCAQLNDFRGTFYIPSSTSGKFHINDDSELSSSVSSDNLLLRGSQLVDTDWILGIVSFLLFWRIIESTHKISFNGRGYHY